MSNERGSEKPTADKFRVVVLGGSGFIGRHLTATLARSGYSVLGASRRPLASQHENLVNSEVDFLDIESVSEVLEGAHTVVQLVNGINPSTGNSQLIPDIEKELQPQIKFLELCVKLRVKRVIFASSGGAIYGNAREFPTSENYAPVPRNSYGVVKHTIEKYLDLFKIAHGLDFVTLRLSNPYGPGQDFRRSQGFLVPSLLEKISEKQEIVIYGDGNDSRDYVFIDDVVEAIVRSVNLSGESGETINIGGGAHYTVNQVIDEIDKQLGRKVARNYVQRRGSDIPRSFLQISKAQSHLGWAPAVNFREGLKRTMERSGLI